MKFCCMDARQCLHERGWISELTTQKAAKSSFGFKDHYVMEDSVPHQKAIANFTSLEVSLEKLGDLTINSF